MDFQKLLLLTCGPAYGNKYLNQGAKVSLFKTKLFICNFLIDLNVLCKGKLNYQTLQIKTVLRLHSRPRKKSKLTGGIVNRFPNTQCY